MQIPYVSRDAATGGLLHGLFSSIKAVEFEGILEDPDGLELTPYLYWAPRERMWFLAHNNCTPAQLVYEAIDPEAARAWLIEHEHPAAVRKHFG
ncbi:hypothetical protein OG413_44615 [Streptomyces sp. NBC_01433]|uniref:hypothetical protein n=1 Tax=Streptomyces sp. NBC_01433 TaxID=2903864 RepID=UPI002253785E|nr:hypothetical protein [Streptomyces sp. NBC_01433]MCX4682269.1 hypothetical protein [Streptomyces sp. NBC_01433]